MKEHDYRDPALRIEGDLRKKLQSSSSRSSFLPFLKKKLLKYKRKSRDWVRYVDRSFSWINGQYALGLFSTESPRAIRTLTRYYDRLLLVNRLGMPVFEVPDQTIHGEVLLSLYEQYGKKRFLPLIREAAARLKRIAAENDGLVIYWPPDRTILVDTLGMIPRFCYHYAELFNDPEMAAIADRLLDFTEERCMDPECGLPFHAYDLETGRPGGSSTWGRGIGWYLLGLTARAERNEAWRDRLFQVFELVFRTQDAEGFLWDDLAQQKHVDSSPTCMAALCLARCLDRELYAPEQSAELPDWLRGCISALLSSVNEAGEVLNCSGECEGAGVYAQKFGNYFSQGYTLMLFKMLEQSERLRRYLNASDEVTQ